MNTAMPCGTDAHAVWREMIFRCPIISRTRNLPQQEQPDNTGNTQYLCIYV